MVLISLHARPSVLLSTEFWKSPLTLHVSPLQKFWLLILLETYSGKRWSQFLQSPKTVPVASQIPHFKIQGRGIQIQIPTRMIYTYYMNADVIKLLEFMNPKSGEGSLFCCVIFCHLTLKELDSLKSGPSAPIFRATSPYPGAF